MEILEQMQRMAEELLTEEDLEAAISCGFWNCGTQ